MRVNDAAQDFCFAKAFLGFVGVGIGSCDFRCAAMSVKVKFVAA